MVRAIANVWAFIVQTEAALLSNTLTNCEEREGDKKPMRQKFV